MCCSNRHARHGNAWNPNTRFILDNQTFTFRTQLESVYEGEVEAIHDARVATRRTRELLALVPVVPGRAREDDAAKACKKVGRVLGRVRDIDVQLALIQNLEAHATQTAPSLVIIRQDCERERLSKTRRLIKTLERIDVGALLHAASEGHPGGLRRRLMSNGWQRQLSRLVIERAPDAVTAIAHATGVYFPSGLIPLELRSNKFATLQRSPMPPVWETSRRQSKPCERDRRFSAIFTIDKRWPIRSSDMPTTKESRLRKSS